MKRFIQIPQFPEIHPLPVMKQVFTEFAGAFEDHGCTIRVVKSFEDLEDGGLILIDNAAGQYMHHNEVYERMAQRCPQSIFICWYWTDSTFMPFKRFLHTGDDCLFRDRVGTDRQIYYSLPTFVPLKFRANDSPARIGTYPRKVELDFCYMGGGYRMDWVPTEFEGLYHRVNCCDHVHNDYLPYDKRREYYLSSLFAFGFQADENIRTGNLTQRIFEGLAYGCVVLCENKFAEEFTDGAVVYVSSKEDLVEKMRHFKAHPELVEKHQRMGY